MKERDGALIVLLLLGLFAWSASGGSSQDTLPQGTADVTVTPTGWWDPDGNWHPFQI